MKSASYTIAFDFYTDGRMKIHLLADVEVHHSETYYIVKNFRPPGRTGPSILPDIRLKKLKGQWVHTDSEKVTELGLAAGRAIDEQGAGEDT